jgi:hypothetical protein
VPLRFLNISIHQSRKQKVKNIYKPKKVDAVRSRASGAKVESVVPDVLDARDEFQSATYRQSDV